MSQTNLENLIKLSELDKEINHYVTQISIQEKEINLFSKSLQDLELELTQAQEKVNTLKKIIHQADLELKILDSQEKEKQSKLQNTSNTKEYFSLEHELENIKSKKSSLESSVFNYWQDLEQIQASYQNLFEGHKNKIDNLKKEIESNKARILRFNEQLNRANKIRPDLESKVEADLLKKYKNLREKISNPMIPAYNESCSACLYILPSKDLNLLKQGKLVECPNCFRLLYLPEKFTKNDSTIDI